MATEKVSKSITFKRFCVVLCYDADFFKRNDNNISVIYYNANFLMVKMTDAVKLVTHGHTPKLQRIQYAFIKMDRPH